MDDYNSWITPTFSISIILLYVFSLYKISLEYVSSKELSLMKGSRKKYIEKLNAKGEKLYITLSHITTFFSVLLSLSGYLFFRIEFAQSIPDQGLLTLSSLIAVMLTLFITTDTLPYTTSFLRLQVLYISPIVNLLSYLMGPTVSMVYKLRAIAFNIENGNAKTNISMDDLSDAVEIVSKASTPEDKRILTGMVRFANADVCDIMCPRTDMVAINSTATIEEVMEVVDRTGFSRIPIYRDVLDNIIGILYTKDLIININKDDFEWISIIRKPYFVSDEKMINELLVQFQKKKIHLAIVVDEYGSTLGIVSMEDILEEIVGEIEDESDTDEPFYKKIDENTYIFEGKTAIGDFLQVLDVSAEEIEDIREDAETLSGLIVQLRQDVPKMGSKAYMLDFCFTVVKIENHRIERVKVTKIIPNV